MQSWDKMIVLCTLVGNICTKHKLAWILMLNCHRNTTDRQGHSVYQQDKMSALFMHMNSLQGSMCASSSMSVMKKLACVYDESKGPGNNQEGD